MGRGGWERVGFRLGELCFLGMSGGAVGGRDWGLRRVPAGVGVTERGMGRVAAGLGRRWVLEG